MDIIFVPTHFCCKKVSGMSEIFSKSYTASFKNKGLEMQKDTGESTIVCISPIETKSFFSGHNDFDIMTRRNFETNKPGQKIGNLSRPPYKPTSAPKSRKTSASKLMVKKKIKKPKVYVHLCS